MKNWWLKLYTFPSLMITARSTAVVMIIAIAINIVEPSELGWICFISCYIGLSHRKTVTCSLSSNLDFHKLHVPFPQLKKAVLADSALRAGAVLFGSFICNLFAYINGGYDKIDDSFFIFSSFGFQAIMVMLMTSVNPIVNGKYTYSPINYEKMNKYVFYFVNSIVAIIVATLLVIPVFFGFQTVLIIPFWIMSLIFYNSFYTYRFAFHQDKPISNYKTYWPALGKVFGTAVLGYVFIAVASAPLINNHRVDMDFRQAAFSLVGDLGPDMDNETAIEFIKANRYNRIKLAAILRNSPEIYQVPVSEILPKPRMSEYVTYLATIENPSSENIKFIMANPIPKTERNGSLYPELNKLVVEKWPKGQNFPKHLLAKEIITEQRSPASTEK